MWKDLLKEAFPVLQKAAPVLAGTLGSPMAGLGATWAMSLLANAFGVKPNEIEDLQHCIIGDSQAEDKLKQVEDIFKQWIGHNSMHMPMPSSAELNIKMCWQNQ